MIITINRATELGGIALAVGEILQAPEVLAAPILATGKAVETPNAIPTMSLVAGDPRSNLPRLRMFGDSIGVSDGALGYVTNADALRKYWRPKRGKGQVKGGRPAVVLVAADSLGYGITSNGGANDTVVADWSWPQRMSAILNARLGTTEPQIFAGSDARLTLAGGAATTASVGLLGRAVAVQGAGHTVTTPSMTFTSLEVWYYESNGTSSDVDTGVFSVNIDAAGATSMTDASAFRTYKVYAPADVSAGSHSAVISRVSGANYIAGIMGYTKANAGSGIAVGRFTLPGSALSDHLGLAGVNAALTAPGQARLLAAYGAMGSPDLVIIGSAHNDATYYDTATYSAYLDTIIAQIGSTIPVLLLAPPFPPAAQDTTSFGARIDYWEVMRAKALLYPNVAHARIGDMLISRALGDANSMYNDGTTVHMSPQGYASVAQFLASILLS